MSMETRDQLIKSAVDSLTMDTTLKRKVGCIGNTYQISIPIEWGRNTNLAKGDELTLELIKIPLEERPGYRYQVIIDLPVKNKCKLCGSENDTEFNHILGICGGCISKVQEMKGRAASGI